jgi:regulator of sigma E protease
MDRILFYVEGIPAFLLLLIVLVAAHEFGHYVFARTFNMGVEEFAVGMFGRRPLLRWGRRTYRLKLRPGEDPHQAAKPAGFDLESSDTERPVVVIDGPTGPELEEYTDFTIRPWPIGGFVRIKGMAPQLDGGEIHVPGGFYSKPAWQRFIVLLAGPVFSVLAGVTAMIPVFMVQGDMRSSNDPVLGPIMQGKSADLAGLREGDRILSIDGQPVKTFYQIMQRVESSPNIPLKFVYSDAGQVKTTTVTPYLSPEPMPLVGPDLEETGEIAYFGMMGVARNRLPVHLGFGQAALTALRVPVQDVVGLLGIVKHPSLAKESVGGPVTMVTATSNAVQGGFGDVVMIAAIISISVGIFNLLPVVPLDGGQMVVALAEMVRGGRRLSIRLQELVTAVGAALVMILVVCVLGVDLTRVTAKEPPPPKFRPSPAAPAPAHLHKP